MCRPLLFKLGIQTVQSMHHIQTSRLYTAHALREYFCKPQARSQSHLSPRVSRFYGTEYEI